MVQVAAETHLAGLANFRLWAALHRDSASSREGMAPHRRLDGGVSSMLQQEAHSGHRIHQDSAMERCPPSLQEPTREKFHM